MIIRRPTDISQLRMIDIAEKNLGKITIDWR